MLLVALPPLRVLDVRHVCRPLRCVPISHRLDVDATHEIGGVLRGRRVVFIYRSSRQYLSDMLVRESSYLIAAINFFCLNKEH